MNLTRAVLIRILSEQVGLTKKSSKEVVGVFLDAIIRSLSKGEEVKLRNFGKFHIIEQKARNFLLPLREKGKRLSPFKTNVRFRPSKFLKALVNDNGVGCSEWIAGFEQIYDNIVSFDRLASVLKYHREWLDTQGRKGKRADLSRCNIEGADLNGVNLKNAKLTSACLDRVDLSNADLDNADFENASLKSVCMVYASLKGANLKEAVLERADLKEADFENADLSGANLQYADLSGAELENAKLADAKFFNTNLKDTILDRNSSISLKGSSRHLGSMPKRKAGGWDCI